MVFPQVQTQGKIIKALKNNKANNYQIAKSAAERQELWRVEDLLMELWGKSDQAF